MRRAVDVEAARAAARAALAPRPPVSPPLPPPLQRRASEPATPPSGTPVPGTIRRVSAASILPFGALSLAGRATPPVLTRCANDDADIDAILRGLGDAR